jgi:hypothetical protein
MERMRVVVVVVYLRHYSSIWPVLVWLVIIIKFHMPSQPQQQHNTVVYGMD